MNIRLFHPDGERITDENLMDLIDYLGPCDLNKLYRRLGLTSQAVQKAKDAVADSRDEDSKDWNVLEMWRQRQGPKATQEVILHALRQCSNVEAAEELEDKWDLSN